MIQRHFNMSVLEACPGGTHRRLEVAPRDDRSSKNEPNRVDTDRAPSLARLDMSHPCPPRHLAPSLLEGLPKSSQKRIAAHVKCRTLYRGDLIFEEGDPPTGYFFIAAGAVSIYKRQSAFLADDDGAGEASPDDPEDAQVWYASEAARVAALGELIVTLEAGKGCEIPNFKPLLSRSFPTRFG